MSSRISVHYMTMVLALLGTYAVTFTSNGGYTLRYDSHTDIIHLAEKTFLVHVSKPTADQLLLRTKVAELDKTNDVILKFMKEHNKTLGIKNNEIDKIVTTFYNTLNQLVNAMKGIRGTVSNDSTFTKNQPTLVKKLQEIEAHYRALEQKIDKLLSKKLSLIGSDGKKLLKLQKELIQMNSNFVTKLVNLLEGN